MAPAKSIGVSAASTKPFEETTSAHGRANDEIAIPIAITMKAPVPTKRQIPLCLDQEARANSMVAD
jgi:hypothetical protein